MTNTIAQEIISWSDPIDVPRGESFEGFFLSPQSAPYILTSYNDALIVHSLGRPGAEPTFIQASSDAILEKYHISDDKLLVLQSSKTTQGATYLIDFYLLGADSIALVNKQQIQLAKKRLGGAYQPLHFNVSKDGRHILICQQEAFTSSGKGILNLAIINDSTHEVVHIPSEFDGDDIEILGASIDNAGNAYIAAKTGIKLKSPFRKKYLIYSYDPANKVLTEFDLSSNDIFIQDLVITTGDTGVFVTSLYSIDPIAEERITGYGYVRLSPDGKEVEDRLLLSLGVETIASHMALNQQSLEYVEDLFLNKTIMVGDVPFLVMEKQYHDQICTADPRTGIMTCTDQYYFNGVTLQEVSDRKNNITFEKRQMDYDRPGPYTSHSITTFGDEGILLFNDHFKNARIGDGKVMNDASRSVMRYVVFTNQLEYRAGVVSSSKPSDYVFMPMAGLVRRGNRIHFLASDGRSFRSGSFDISKLQ